MRKVLPIPAHIIDSGDDIHWFNIVSGIGNRIGTVDRSENNMEIYNIKLSQIKAVLEETANSLFGLLTSDNINNNSYYRSDKTTPYSMGKMAGYNHLAKPSTYFSEGSSWGEIDVNITFDGANWKMTISGLALQRGEKIPSSGYVATWNNITVEGAIYKKDGEFWEAEPTDTDTKTGINVTQMRNNTSVSGLIFDVPNENETYLLSINGKYTHQSSDTFQSLSVIIHAKKFYPYDLQVGSGLSGWTPGVMKPLPGSSNYALEVMNIAPDEGNSQSYLGTFYVKFTFYYEITPVSYYALSQSVKIDPQEAELMVLTWNEGEVPAIGVLGWNDAKEYSVSIYLGTSTLGTLLTKKVWNEGQ